LFCYLVEEPLLALPSPRMQPTGRRGAQFRAGTRSAGALRNVSWCGRGHDGPQPMRIFVSPQRRGPTRKRTELGRGGRILAAALAAIWLAAGLAALALGVWLRPAIVPVLLSPLALGYAWLWARVAVTGRRQEWPRWSRGGQGR
jgi:hypothetical protein